MIRAQWKEEWQREERAAMEGWDFSRLAGRWQEGSPPWDYRAKVKEFLRPGVRLLDLGTGGGELLLSLGHPPELTWATEGWEPNYRLCQRRLIPMGIHVERYDSEKNPRLPFEDGVFDLVLDRHESYDLPEVYRVLKPGGFFLTQQVGGMNNRALSRRLTPEFQRGMLDFNLENEAPKFCRAGFRIMWSNQAYYPSRFLDVGALCWYAKACPWEFGGFSVEKCYSRLLELQAGLEARGFLESLQHRFIIVAKKTGKSGGENSRG